MPLVYNGKCSRCEVMKSEYEFPPAPYDCLLCKMCFDQVTKNALRDHELGLLIEDLYKISKRLRLMLS
jgi:hypothetical protein